MDSTSPFQPLQRLAVVYVFLQEFFTQYAESARVYAQTPLSVAISAFYSDSILYATASKYQESSPPNSVISENTSTILFSLHPHSSK